MKKTEEQQSTKYKRLKKSIYALYKGDEFLDSGTVEELSLRHCMKKQTIYGYATPSYYKRFVKKWM